MKKIICLLAVILTVCFFSSVSAEDPSRFLGEWSCSKVIVDGKTYTSFDADIEFEVAIKTDGIALVKTTIEHTEYRYDGFWLASGKALIVTDGDFYIPFELNDAGKLVVSAENTKFIFDRVATLEINEKNFPDPAFREYVEDHIGDEYGMVKQWTVDTLDELIIYTVSSFGDLRGIEFFTNLRTLDCSGLRLTSLDVSKNKKLRELNCGGNQLTELDVSRNTNLTRLSCYENQLTSLDVSRNTKLTELSCSYNQLTSLDVSGNKALTWLDCDNNKLTELDVSKNKKLKHLSCNDNQLTAINVGKNAALESLNCSSNPLKGINVSKNAALSSLDCMGIGLKSIDLSHNPNLTSINCRNNLLTSLDISQNPELWFVFCDGNQLTSLDLTGHPLLKSVSCNDNRLTELNIRQNKNLYRLECSGNQLAGLDVSRNKGLIGWDSVLSCEGNRMEVSTSDGTVLFGSLPGFKISKASDIVFAGDENPESTMKKGKNMFTVKESGTITYTYDVGLGFKRTFSIHVTYDRTELASLTLAKTNYAYTGSAIEPAATVKAKADGKTVTLKKGTDYTVTYENNTEIGTATVTVEGKGKYKGILTKDFNIVRAKITSVTLSKSNAAYNGKAWEPAVTVKRNDILLTADTDYTVTYKNNVNAGTATVTVKGKGNYTGTISKTFTIKPIKILKVTLSSTSLPYTGKARTPVPTVNTKIAGQLVTLTRNTDYTVAYENNVGIGKGTVTVTAKGNYTGTITRTFTITPAEILKVTLSSTSLPYTGKAHTPVPTVTAKIAGRMVKLNGDTDYTVAYESNVSAGTAAVIVKGIGNYKGTVRANFTITPVKILKVTLSSTSLPYTGKARKPIPTVTTKVDGQLVTLVKNTDYTVKYENNVEIGTATVTVTGKGDYTGTITKTFRIE